ncbi:ketoacyl-ACP synthase III [Telmatocola sphagniphila]|uniref:Beta-ketoacyl-[acyl-carrier-protein] synthase III n=2 Tax=Telmatocola sphagniphila TaxID=1123043 RepID=A0A8E6BBD4_9BACT|nr:ketoacyl-ACP synthase III [Telmatocola sphagniphila]
MTGEYRSALVGTGCQLPGRVFTNDEFVATIDTSDEWIRTRTGIRERRFALPSETASSLGIEAARKALENCQLTGNDLDLIICATVTPDMMTPATACLLQSALKCRHIPSFDLTAACTGFLYGMSVADQFIRTGTCRNVLVVGTEILSRAIDFSDRNSCILFGDGAGAVILQATKEPNRGIRSVNLFADGERQRFIQVPGMATITQPGEQPIKYLQMNGREVFKFAVQRMVELIHHANEEAAKLGTHISMLIPHQVNQRIIDAALESTGFPADRVMVNLDRYGNTSAASVPIALDEAIREGRAKKGDTVLLVAFGGGLTWGSSVVTL